MKALARVALIAGLLALTGCLPKPPVQPTQFSPPDQSFSVMMPGAPSVKVLEAKPEVNFKGGNSYQVQSDGRLFMTGYFDYSVSPPGMHSDSLDRFRDMFVAGTKGQLISEDTVMLDGNTGREIIIKNPSGSSTRVRIFIKEKRAFIAGVEVHTDTDANAPTVNDFLNSFHIKET
jgi:hypothetical protein